MNNTPKLSWYQLARDELPGISVGLPVPRDRKQDNEPTRSFNADFAGSVGFAWETNNSLEYSTPAIFVLQDQNLSETLSWLRAFARDSFPLSQFGRVISTSDWQLVTNDDSVGRSFRDDRWASVILGELLAQSEQDATLESLSLSRVQACFSTAVARTQKYYDSLEATRICTERLRTIEADSRFLRRSVVVDQLVPAWSMASASFGEIKNISELAEFVISAAQSYENIGGKPREKDLTSLPSGLFSDSIEERVTSFQTLASRLMDGTAVTRIGDAAIMAVAAFLVGRGTSHAFLLKKHPRASSLAHIWFGLISGIAGPAYWDPAWMKALKGVEKHIRAAFSWSDPPLVDLSWAEYQWVSGAVRGSHAFTGIPRQVQASLSIEVLPAVSCQMRLHNEEVKTTSKEAPSHLQEAYGTSTRLPDEALRALEQLVKLSDQARDIIKSNRRNRPSAFESEPSDDLFKSSDKGKKINRKPSKQKQ